MSTGKRSLDDEKFLVQFFNDEKITDPIKQEQFRVYLDELRAWNKITNLTAIETVKGIAQYHFQDSVALAHYIDMHSLKMIADVGTGGGFPGIPLKILFPHLQILLIEVNHKKIQFLEHIINTLPLTDVTISDADWRTFLRTTQYPIELFCARASLQPEELVRVFKPSSVYKQCTLVYWASNQWQPGPNVIQFITRTEVYKIGQRTGKLVFFSTEHRKDAV